VSDWRRRRCQGCFARTQPGGPVSAEYSRRRQRTNHAGALSQLNRAFARINSVNQSTTKTPVLYRPILTWKWTRRHNTPNLVRHLHNSSFLKASQTNNIPKNISISLLLHTSNSHYYTPLFSILFNSQILHQLLFSQSLIRSHLNVFTSLHTTFVKTLPRQHFLDSNNYLPA